MLLKVSFSHCQIWGVREEEGVGVGRRAGRHQLRQAVHPPFSPGQEKADEIYLLTFDVFSLSLAKVLPLEYASHRAVSPSRVNVCVRCVCVCV